MLELMTFLAGYRSAGRVQHADQAVRATPIPRFKQPENATKDSSWEHFARESQHHDFPRIHSRLNYPPEYFPAYFFDFLTRN